MIPQASDEGTWTRRQQRLVALTALTIIFDGADIQLLGIAVPAMAAEWGTTRGAFAPVLASGLAGMMIGGALGGIAGDRFGRKVALVASLVAFSVLTLAVAAADSLVMLGTLRFLAGLGFGGTVPNAAALTSEYVPERHRPFAVTLTIVCVPLGGTLAALFASQVLPTFGWRALFAVGGLLPLAVALLLTFVLPESPRFLAERPVNRATPLALFSADLRRDTTALWVAFVFCLLAVYTGFNWVPSMLTTAGLDVGVASTGLAAFNLGGVAGAIGGALMISRIGSRLTMLGMAAGAIAGALAMSTMTVTAASGPVPVIVMLGVTGGLINAVQTTMYALAAHVYPTAIRATGVGSATAVGRLGAVASTYAGAWALEAGGMPLFFGLVAGAMMVVVASLAVVRRHIPRYSQFVIRDS